MILSLVLLALILPQALAAFVFILGSGLTFYGMWNLQLGPENWRGIAAVLMGILGIMYGTGLFLYCFS